VTRYPSAFPLRKRTLVAQAQNNSKVQGVPSEQGGVDGGPSPKSFSGVMRFSAYHTRRIAPESTLRARARTGFDWSGN
jgi:hypothetical protein